MNHIWTNRKRVKRYFVTWIVSEIVEWDYDSCSENVLEKYFRYMNPRVVQICRAIGIERERAIFLR